MPDIAKINGVAIPDIKSIPMTPETVADESRTASLKMNRDMVGVKRRWKITASSLTPTERDSILGVLTTANYGAVAFWLDEFGLETNTVDVYVTVDQVNRINKGKGGVWGLFDMDLTIVEK